MALGRWLVRWREASRLTQAEVARRTEIVQHQISRLERDEIERPTMRDIVRIISVYGVSPNEAAQKGYDWLPPKEYRSEDYRWQFLKDLLAGLDDENREALMVEIYDKAVWYSELTRRAAQVV